MSFIQSKSKNFIYKYVSLMIQTVSKLLRCLSKLLLKSFISHLRIHRHSSRHTFYILYLSEYEQNQHILYWRLKFSFGYPSGANSWAVCKIISVSSAIIGDILDRHFECFVVFRFGIPAIDHFSVCSFGSCRMVYGPIAGQYAKSSPFLAR